MENLKNNLITLDYLKEKKFDNRYGLLTNTLHDVFKKSKNNKNLVGGSKINLEEEKIFLKTHQARMELFVNKYFKDKSDLIKKIKQSDKTLN